MGTRSLPRPTLQQIVDRARILVIDDEDFPYGALFRRDGYNVTKWHDVTKLPEIEQGKYDIILLDLQGIGKKISKDQGLGVLRHIKQVRPTQVVVAYSNADWPVEYQPFFDLADDVLPKSADYVQFKQSVDELLQEHFSVGFHLQRLDAELERLGANDWWSRRVIRRAVADGELSKVRRTLKRRNVDDESTQVIIGLVQIAVGVAQVWTN
jgi:CheY-like chemotaxis protein